MSPDSRQTSISRKHWTLSWWDLWPLVDGERRPLQWTNTSIIFTPHPLSPVVVARYYPSASSFILPSPPPLLENPSGYAPPNIIEVSNGEERVFAFFEGRGGDHCACVWHRNENTDTWTIGIYWSVKQGQRIVLAKWLDVGRTWIRTSPPRRTPLVGPKNVFGKLSLLLITQSHIVQIIHQISPRLPYRVISASLRHTTTGNTFEPTLPGHTVNGPGGLAVCVKAAVGLGYGETSIIIATHSIIIPTPTSTSNTDFSDQFGVPKPPSPPPISPPNSYWDKYGPEQEIQICEVRVTIQNTFIVIAKPLQPLFPQVTSSSHLTDILIVSHLSVEEPSSPDGSTAGNDLPNTQPVFKPCMHIVLNYLDFEDYASPKSALMCFELKRSDSSPTESSKFVSWSHRHLHTRKFANVAVTFLLPVRVPTSKAVIAGLLDTEGHPLRAAAGERKPKDVSIGRIVRLRLPEMTDDDDWEPSRLIAKADNAGTDPPISAVMSPSESFICTSSAAWSTVPKLNIHASPTIKSSTGTPDLSSMSDSLLSSILSNLPSDDIIYVLSDPSLLLSSVITIVEKTLSALESSNLFARDWHSHFAGILLDIYRSRSRRLSKETSAESREQTTMEDRWHVALDICSVKALKGAFEACQEDDEYDMDPVWHLIALLTWLVDFSERLIRACVLWEGSLSVQSARKTNETPQDSNEGEVKVKVEAMEVDGDDLLDGDDLFDGELSPAPDSSISSLPSPLIHLLHPYTLDNFLATVSHLNMFRAFLDTLTASQLKASLAKEVVIDVIDCSAIDFKELELALRKIKQLDEFTMLDADTLQRSFCLLSPLPSTRGFLLRACGLVTSPTTVSKPRLFINPSELVDGVSKLNLETVKMHLERDVVSKGILGVSSALWTCARCHGKTKTGQTPWPSKPNNYSRWEVWEHEWERCICGGMWMKGAVR